MIGKAPILVHGATGFTGTLVCEALAARGLPFAVSGRSKERLERLRDRIHPAAVRPAELCVVDVTRPETVRDAVSGRSIVLAVAGPFVDVGEPVLAACARLGIHYADTTGEQRYVADAVLRYHHEAEESGACIVPSMAFEIAPADWVSHLASARLGGAPDTLDVLYANKMADGGYGGATTRGTKMSALRMLGEPEPLQYVDGALRMERAGEKVTSFALPSGRRLVAASFPSPEAVVVPAHTGARNVRTYMAMGPRAARAIHELRRLAPLLARAARPLGDRFVARTAAGPEGEARTDASFTVLAEATKGNERARVALTGVDPYGLTAAIQAYAAERALAGAISARGVVGPSVAFPPREAIAALAGAGLTLVDPA